MRLIVDKDIVQANLFTYLGDVIFAKGQDITSEHTNLGEADALIIRSVTKVTMPLLRAAPRLRFICTATIGLDHIDEKAIAHLNTAEACDIQVIHAPGVTAEAVADYVWQNIFHLAAHRGQPVESLTLGIVGYGNCGKAVARRAEMLRMNVVLCDPPLQCRDRSFISASYEQAFACDIVTLHVPLTRPDESDYPTFHMINDDSLKIFSGSTSLINTSRGAVINEKSLLAALDRGQIQSYVLDVFTNEPNPSREIIHSASIATPHVAGSTHQGKLKATLSILSQLCPRLHRSVPPMPAMPEPPAGVGFEFDIDQEHPETGILEHLTGLTRLSREFQSAWETRGPSDGAFFEKLRRSSYRHGLSSFVLAVRKDLPKLFPLMKRLETMGISFTERMDQAHGLLK